MRVLRILIVICVGGLIAALSVPTNGAQAMSSGCVTTNGIDESLWLPLPGGTGIGTGWIGGAMYFEAGEIFGLTPSQVGSGTVTLSYHFGISSVIPPQTFVEADVESLPNPVTFVIPETGIYYWQFDYVFTGATGAFNLFCEEPVAGAIANDGRLPLNLPDGAVYANEQGISVYLSNGENASFLAVAISADELAEYPAQPEENTLLASSVDGYINIYLLTTGEYQINIGPDAEGKVTVVIFTGLPPTNVYRRDFNVNGILHPQG